MGCVIDPKDFFVPLKLSQCSVSFLAWVFISFAPFRGNALAPPGPDHDAISSALGLVPLDMLTECVSEILWSCIKDRLDHRQASTGIGLWMLGASHT